MREILRQLLDFSRPPQVSHGPIDLGAIARQAAELVTAQKAYADIDFEIEIEPGAGAAMGDASRASQILLNLAITAASALEGVEERRVRIEIGRSVLVPRAEDGDVDLPEGRLDAIRVRVADSGPGVVPEARERIFDPFFTTKAPGEGTGLGLANSRRLAQEMGGDVVLEEGATPLSGACFGFRLPRAGGSDASESGVRGAPRSADESAGPACSAPRPQSRMP